MSSDIYTNITEDTQEQEPISIDPEQFLRTANCLSEFSEDALKRAVRNNLELYKKDEIDSIIESDKSKLERDITDVISELRTHKRATNVHGYDVDIANLLATVQRISEEIGLRVASLDFRISSIENINIELELRNLNSNFNNYYTKREVREKCNSIVEDAIETTIKELINTEIQEHLDASDPHGTYARVQLNFVSKLSLENLDFSDVPALTAYINDKVTEAITYSGRLGRWQTYGPVLKTVGYVSEGTDFEDKALSLQYIMDRIFYNRGEVSLIAPEYVFISSKANLVILVPGNTDNITEIKLYQDGDQEENLINTFTKEDIDANGEIHTLSRNIFNDSSTFLVKLYSTTTPHEPATDEAIVKCGYYAFVGVDYWASFANHNSWEYLKRLESEGKGTFFGPEPHDSLTTRLSAYDINRNPFEFFVVIPKAWGTLESLLTQSQEFTVDAFNFNPGSTSIDVPVDDDTCLVPVWVYTYKQKIFRCDNLEVTYNINHE